MRLSRLPRHLPFLLTVLACGDPGPVAPTPPRTPALAAHTCALGMSDADARVIINSMTATVNALQASGALTSGQASALRKHLENVLSSIAAGNYCAAAAQLQAFRQQVGNFVSAGILTEAQAAPLTGGAGEVLQGPLDQVTFMSGRDGNFEIYRVKSDGTDLRNLTNNPGWDASASWSPDGSKVVFASNREGPFKIFVMNADGSNLVRITDDAAGDGRPLWSPDGQRIAFERGGFDVLNNRELWVMDANGANQVRLTNNTADDGWHTWSPDGTRLVFHSNRAGNYDIFVINRDGSGETALTANSAFDGFPLWSPDGTRIVFRTERDGNTELYTVAPNGSGTTRLTTSTVFNAPTGWSPDGSTLAFNRCTVGFMCQVYTISRDGTGETNLSNDAAVGEFEAVWSPDGTRLAFNRVTSASPLRRDVYIVNRDGTNKRNITNSTADNFSIAWRSR